MSYLSRRGFTLIEILVVITIIGILIGLLFPAIKGAILKAKVAQAKQDERAIVNAIRQYITEYGKLPVKDASQGVPDIYYDSSSQFQIMNALRAIASGDNASDALNKKKIVFLEPPSRKGSIDSLGNILDPWGQVYYIKLDNNYDNIVDYFSPPNRSGPVVVVSYGANKTQETPNTSAGDDVVSFQ